MSRSSTFTSLTNEAAAARSLLALAYFCLRAAGGRRPTRRDYYFGSTDASAADLSPGDKPLSGASHDIIPMPITMPPPAVAILAIADFEEYPMEQ